MNEKFESSNIEIEPHTWNPTEGNHDVDEENDQQVPSNPYLDGSRKQDPLDQNINQNQNQDDEAEPAEEGDEPRFGGPVNLRIKHVINGTVPQAHMPRAHCERFSSTTQKAT